MYKSKYDLMKESIVKDDQGKSYPDLATFSINDFTPATRFLQTPLHEQDIYTFYNLIYKIFGSFNLYDDIILWLNDIPYLDNTQENVVLKLYDKADIDNWYFKYL